MRSSNPITLGWLGWVGKAGLARLGWLVCALDTESLHLFVEGRSVDS